MTRPAACWYSSIEPNSSIIIHPAVILRLVLNEVKEHDEESQATTLLFSQVTLYPFVLA